jgi:hypothetical protein
MMSCTAEHDSPPCGRVLLCVLVAAALTACAGKPNQPRGAESVVGRIVANDAGLVPQPLARHVVADSVEGSRNVVLNAMLAAKVAFDIGAVKQSRALLDEAYQRIEVVYADNAAAAKARSTFAPEATKDFKGEPYERAMLGYYLGLSDLITGDLDNARSAFKWGEFQDTMSASEVYQGDMASLMFLEAWVDHCRGKRTTAVERFQQAAKARPGLNVPQESHNLLVIHETGAAPAKVRSGKHGEELSYEPDRGSAARPRQFEVDGSRISLALAEDIHWQATTLGGRQVDKLLAGKASFKNNAQAVSTTGKAFTLVGIEAMKAGAMSGDRSTFLAAQGVAGIGLAMNIFGGIAASAAKPEADIRTWSNLPGKLYFTTAQIAMPASGKVANVKVLAGVSGGEVLVRALPTGNTPCALARYSDLATETWAQDDPATWVSIAGMNKQAAAEPAKPVTATSDKPTKMRATF